MIWVRHAYVSGSRSIPSRWSGKDWKSRFGIEFVVNCGNSSDGTSKWGQCEYAIDPTILPPSPVILWINCKLGGKPNLLPLALTFGYHNVMHTSPIGCMCRARPSLTVNVSRSEDSWSTESGMLCSSISASVGRFFFFFFFFFYEWRSGRQRVDLHFHTGSLTDPKPNVKLISHAPELWTRCLVQANFEATLLKERCYNHFEREGWRAYRKASPRKMKK